MSLSQKLRLPRQKRFFFVLSLPSANKLLLFLFILNKITAIYGVLSLLTGVPVSVLQGTMYMYSVGALLLVLFYISPRSRMPGASSTPPDPFCVVLWAYVYFIDAVINAIYTASFAFLWFLHIALEEAGQDGDGGKVDQSNPDFSLDFGQALFQNGSIASLILVVSLWVLRFYTIFTIFAYCRLVLHQWIAMNSSTVPGIEYASFGSGGGMAENPFERGTAAGEGVKGRIGRTLIQTAPKFWLTKDAHPEVGAGSADPESGLSLLRSWFVSSAPVPPEYQLDERERRRRRGTGPPTRANSDL